MSSGDVGYFDEHDLLYVSGRDDEMIVSGGENVFPAEIEDLISGHPEVVEATALGVEDKEWGHRLRAFVVKTDGASIGEDDIKTYVREHLARYKVPREVVFLEELPRNPTGKVLKRELREMEVDGVDAKAGGDDEKGATGGDDDKAAIGGDDGKAGAE
jgi:fatty-acyl-CoA synthase